MAEISQSRTVTINQARAALKYCINVKRPVMLWGPPGIGKSDLIAQMCVADGGKLYDLRLSQMDVTDLRGIPFFNKESGKMEWAPPVDLPSLEEAEKHPVVYLFLDELNSAAPSVQAAAYQLILNRKIGTYTLPDNCIMVAAGNREGDKGVVFRMPSPLANRFVHLELAVDFDSWYEWAIENKINADVVGFINFSKNSLYDFDPKSPSKAFATPRTWEFTSQILVDGIENDVAANLIAGTIGEGLMLKFMAHRKHSSNLPKIEDIFSGKVTELKTKEISAMYSLATSISYELDAANKAKSKNWDAMANNAIKFMKDNFAIELVIMSIKTMLQQLKLPFVGSKVAAYKEFIAEYGTIILKANKI